MFIVKNNDITMTKGDYGVIDLKFQNRDGSDYIVEEDDEIVFSIKKEKERFYPLILEKKGERIVFESEETKNIPSGGYRYEVKIRKRSGIEYIALEGNFKVGKAVGN